MRITIEPTGERTSGFEGYHPSVSIEVNGDSLNVFDLVEVLIKPAIMAMGYSQECIEDAFFENAGERTEDAR